MNYTFQRVAAFCGLRLSYYSTSALLTLIFLVLMFTEYRTYSPLYILLLLAVLPSVLKAMFFSNTKHSKTEKRENASAFPLFCKKYHYNAVQYKAMNLAYFLMFLLFAAWHISYSRVNTAPAAIAALPALLSAISLLIRILGIIGYRLYFHFFPLKAMR